MPTTAPRYLDAGEAALVVELGDRVDPAINDRVLALDRALAARVLPGVRETVPTYRSLMIHYDPLVLSRAALVEALRGVDAAPAPSYQPETLWTVPCCYEGDCAEDLGQVAAMTGLSPERVARVHAGATYRVYMYGFAPGFCYLGGIPEELDVSRRPTPRAPHPANTVLLGGGLTLISTFAMPTAWWLIGRTPERMFAPQRQPSFLVSVGDALRFNPVDRATFARLDARAAAGEVVARPERRR